MTPKQKRERMKFMLSKLTDGNRNIFMRMYSPHDLECDINTVVDTMTAKKLKWAYQQCENSYHRIFRIIKNS
jgi:hypothetical protein